MTSEKRSVASGGASSESPRRKRPRPNHDRARVTRACDQCKRQKIRCTGSQPCEVCVRKRETCTYEASYSRGRAPSPTIRHAEPEISVTATTSQSSLRPDENRLATDQSMSSRPSPEPSQTDRQGHYVGPASSISFLFRVQKRVHQMLQSPPTTSIFTFGDVPLPDLDVSLFMVPPKEDTKRLVELYFDFAVPTHRFLHRRTIEGWHNEFHATNGSMTRDGRPDEAPAKLAVLFMVFAQASLYLPDDTLLAHNNASIRYFLAADHQLAKERGHVRLASVQARLAQCFYLLAQSRINHCWSLFGTTSQLVFAIGLHRGSKSESSSGPKRFEAECRRNVFWSAYTLDKYLSAALGRPRTFREEDIDQELPFCVDHTNLLSETDRLQPDLGQPLMRGVIAHIKLARILDGILRDLYPIKPISTKSRLALTSPYTIKLKQWYTEYEDFLGRKINAALLLKIYQRQRNVLNLAYWHATILAHRPFLLRKLESRQVGPSTTPNTTIEDHVDVHISLCINAAMDICNLVTEIIDSKTMFRAFWFTFYYAFCAVVVIYVVAIQEGPTSQAYDPYLHVAAATKCQRKLSAIAEDNSLGARYCLILEELRKELISKSARLQRDQNGGAVAQPGEAPSVDTSAALPPNPLLSILDAQGDTIEPTLLDASPDSSLHDLSGWGAFDSMVISGFGNFDFFDGEHFTV